MTIRYIRQAASAKYCLFFRLLFRWNGSVHKAILPETIVYGILFCFTMVIYKLVLNESQKKSFEEYCRYSNGHFHLIPISFVIGFYINLVAKRWWSQFMDIPWPDTIAIYTMAMVNNDTDESKFTRKTIMRYINLGFIMCLRNLSKEIKKVYPTNKELFTAGLMTYEELVEINSKDCDENRLMIPLIWAYNMISKIRQDEIISGPGQEKEMLLLIIDYRERIRVMYTYMWIMPPLIYTQITIITVYTYCLFKLISQQTAGQTLEAGFVGNILIQIFAYFEFVFYMGLLKVAESMINPFGKDDEDFNMMPVIERNLAISNIIVDDLCNQYPPLEIELLSNETNTIFEKKKDTDDFGSNHSLFIGSIARIDINYPGAHDVKM